MSRISGVRAPRAASVPPPPETVPPEPPAPPPPLAEPEPSSADPRAEDDEYTLKQDSVAPRPAPSITSHVSTVYSPTPSRRRRAGSGDDSRPFLSAAAVLYPWLYPNCFYWVCLSLLSCLCMAIVALSFFTIGLLPFWLASALMAWLAVAGYIVAAFERIIEQTAYGEDRMQGLPEIGWGEVLPPFLRAFGAMCCAIAVPVAVSYLICRWLPVPGFVMVLPGAVVAYFLFPLLLITNLIDESYIPLKSVPDVLVRASKRLGYFALFLAIIGWLSIVLAGVVGLVFYWNIVAGVFSIGPAATTWLMYYGHLLGRLGEKLMDLE